MSQLKKSKRDLVEGRPALIVVDIQTETFYDRTDEAIPTMPDYADRMLKARSAIDKAREEGIPVIFIQEVHRPDLVDGYQSDYFCRVIEDCVAGSCEEAHEASLRAMEYLQSGARCSLVRKYGNTGSGLTIDIDVPNDCEM